MHRGGVNSAGKASMTEESWLRQGSRVGNPAPGVNKMEDEMSWWVSLEESGKPVEVSRHEEGGTYALGGICDAELNITYNYSPYFYKYLNVDKGLRFLHEKQAVDTVKALAYATFKLGAVRDDDYWKATPGNAGYALSILLQWAMDNPTAIFRVC